MLKPDRHLGQHFLKDKKILKKIADLAISNLPIIEIGAGRGELTKYLAQKAEVIALEKDKRFRKVLKTIPKTRVIIADALQFLRCNLKYLKKNYQVFGNLPFYLEKPIIQQVLQLQPPPKKAVFLINKEVAEGSLGKKSLFALSVEFFANVRVLFSVSKKKFFPEPKVDGRVIVIKDIGYKLPFHLDRKKIEQNFFYFLKLGFSSPRKKLINNLVRGLNVKKQILQKAFFQAKIELNKRAEDLGLNQWLDLFSILKKQNVQFFSENQRSKR